MTARAAKAAAVAGAASVVVVAVSRAAVEALVALATMPSQTTVQIIAEDAEPKGLADRLLLIHSPPFSTGVLACTGSVVVVVVLVESEQQGLREAAVPNRRVRLTLAEAEGEPHSQRGSLEARAVFASHGGSQHE